MIPEKKVQFKLALTTAKMDAKGGAVTPLRPRRLSKMTHARNLQLSDFEIKEKLGEGAFGTVFKVRDKSTSEILVMKQIKIVRSDPGDLNSKLVECKTIGKLNHTNINKYKNHFVADG